MHSEVKYSCSSFQEYVINISDSHQGQICRYLKQDITAMNRQNSSFFKSEESLRFAGKIEQKKWGIKTLYKEYPVPLRNK